MKKYLFVFMLALCFSSLYSQHDSADHIYPPKFYRHKSMRMDTMSLKPGKGYVGLVCNVQGLIQSIQPTVISDAGYDLLLIRYYGSKNHVYRAGIGFQVNSFSRTTLDSINTALVSIDSTNKQSGFYISLANEVHFGNNRRLDPYIGGLIAFSKTGRNAINYSENKKDTIGESNFSIISDMPGSSLFRIGMITGFNYFISRDISLGLEFMLSYDFSRSGGDYSLVSIDKPVSGGETIVRETGTRIQSNHSFGFKPVSNITFSYFFRTK